MGTVVHARGIEDGALSVHCKLAAQEYVLHMAVRQGRVVSKPRSPVFVEALDLSGRAGERALVFRVTVADASTLAHTFPEFTEAGLLGTWRLQTNGLLQLVKVCPAKAPDEVRAFLTSPQSHDVVRVRYEALFEELDAAARSKPE